jgi:hypothetical protein
MTEFVLVVIPFLILLMGILQLLHIAVVKTLVNHAVFTAARVAVINDRVDDITSAAKKALPFKDKENIYVEVSSQRDGEEIKVKLIYKMELIFPVINKIIKELKNLSSYNMPVVAEYSLPKENIVN